jgi:7-carboxy-7-deazaguanine synthase
MLLVNESFRSLQGEGVYAGHVMSFLRLFGCNLACKWCDTPYARLGSNSRDELSVQEVVTKVKGLPTKKGDWLCITGGEPLLQGEELKKIVTLLSLEGIKVTIETNGSYPIPSWGKTVASWNADIKCPSSGEGGKSLEEWLHLDPIHQVKFVISDRTDISFVLKILDRNPKRTSTVLVSPCLSIDSAGNLDRKTKEWIPTVASFCIEKNLIFSLQIHKVIWGAKRGV